MVNDDVFGTRTPTPQVFMMNVSAWYCGRGTPRFTEEALPLGALREMVCEWETESVACEWEMSTVCEWLPVATGRPCVWLPTSLVLRPKSNGVSFQPA